MHRFRCTRTDKQLQTHLYLKFPPVVCTGVDNTFTKIDRTNLTDVGAR